MKNILMAFVLVLAPTFVFSAVPAKGLLTQDGVIRGGQTSTAFMLTDVRKTQDQKKKIERVVIDLGSLTGEKFVGVPTYFNAEFKKKQKVLSLDLVQTPGSKVTEDGLQRLFRNSLAVRSARITVDPEDKTMNLLFNLKNVKALRVLPVAGNKTATSKLVIDFVAE